MDMKSFIQDLNNINTEELIENYCDYWPEQLNEKELVRMYSKELGLQKLISDDWGSNVNSGRHLVYLIRGPRDQSKFHVFTE